MMFKRLGRFAVLAVCLFAMAMVGCDIPLNSVNVPSTQPSVLGGYNLPSDDMKVKLAGVYRLIEHSRSGVTLRAPEVDGVFALPLNGKSSMSLFGPHYGENESGEGRWSADKTHLIIGSPRSGRRIPYSWDGRYLTLFLKNGEILEILKWVKTD